MRFSGAPLHERTVPKYFIRFVCASELVSNRWYIFSFKGSHSSNLLCLSAANLPIKFQTFHLVLLKINFIIHNFLWGSFHQNLPRTWKLSTYLYIHLSWGEIWSCPVKLKTISAATHQQEQLLPLVKPQLATIQPFDQMKRVPEWPPGSHRPWSRMVMPCRTTKCNRTSNWGLFI